MDDRLSLAVTYGPYVALVLALLLAWYWRRSARRARTRAERARPLAMAEARAERDVYRAEYAVEVRGLEQRLEEAREALAKARLAAARDNKLQYDLARALERAVEAESAKSRLERELSDERSRLEALKADLTAREGDTATQAGRLAEAERAAQELRTKLGETEAALSEARAALDSRREEAETAQTRITALSQQLEDLRSAQISGEEVEALRTSLNRANEAAAAEKSGRTTAERTLAERDRELSDKAAALREAERRAAEADTAAADKAKALAEKAEALRQAEQARADAERRLNDYLAKGDQDRVMAASAKARIDLLSQELTDLRSARVSGDEAAALKTSLAEANEALASERGRRLELESRLEQAMHAPQATAPAPAAPTEGAPEAADASEQLRRSLNEANNALAAEKSRRMGLESEAERLRRELADAASAAAAAQAAAGGTTSVASPPARANGADSSDAFDRVAMTAQSMVDHAGSAGAEASSKEADLTDLRHELERLRAENAALARYADGHGDVDRLETAVLRERLQDLAAEIAVVAARDRAAAAADGPGTPGSLSPIGAPDQGAPSLAARVRALSRRRPA
ncbi:hypothetical protein [Amorphus orientalis]|uniref:Chromosome segregation ATPase n=1 Tax=Amorphus orientalis TaxID=649198 RepID=A0AAE3VL65_9HYPH|nr:hypothetical protein [Amorphus orientalis]MDQ0313938.1 chromosome segregation ATPase [Amorphus orientalis]